MGCWGLRQDFVILSVGFDSLQISTLICAEQTKIAWHRWKMPNLALREQMGYPNVRLFWTWKRTSNIMFSAVHSKNTLIQSSLQHPFMLFCKTFCSHYQNSQERPYVSELKKMVRALLPIYIYLTPRWIFFRITMYLNVYLLWLLLLLHRIFNISIVIALH